MVPAARPRRRTRWAAAVVAGLATGLVGAVLVAPGAAGAAPARAAVGPVSSADQDLLVKVRLAGLWEMPAGRMAAEKGASVRVREIGAEISAQHVELDKLVRAAAAKVGVPLPNEPNADQRFWLREMEQSSGAQFDQIFVDRLRAAHGKVFPAIATVRAGTRNDVVRKLAEDSQGFVLNHLRLLESTGLVDYESLPRPAGPGGPAQLTGDGTMLAGAAAAANTRGVDSSLIWIVLAVALAAGGVTTYRMVRSR